MKMRPSRILIAIVGGGILLAALLGVLGIALKSEALKNAGAISFAAAALIACLPLIAVCCYFGWQKLSSAFKRRE